MTDLYLKTDMTHSTVYYSQACMMSTDLATPIDRNIESAAINSTIEVYYKLLKEIKLINKIIKNVA